MSQKNIIGNVIRKIKKPCKWEWKIFTLHVIKGTKSGIFKLSKGQMGRARALMMPSDTSLAFPSIPLGIAGPAGCALPGWDAQHSPSALPLPHIHSWHCPLQAPNLDFMNKKLLAVPALVTICDTGLCCHCGRHITGIVPPNSLRNPNQGTRTLSLEVSAPHPSPFPWLFPPKDPFTSPPTLSHHISTDTKEKLFLKYLKMWK